MKLIKLETLEQFEELKIGDFIIVKWSDYNIKHNEGMEKIMSYSIVENRKSNNEIICRIKGNHYFNYKMLLKRTSGADEAILVRY